MSTETASIRRRRISRRAGVAALFASTLFVAIAAFLYLRLTGTTVAKTATVAPRDYGTYAKQIRSLRADLVTSPCDEPAIVALGGALVSADDPGEALVEVDAYAARCSSTPRLEAVRYRAHRALHEYDKAIAIVSQLIERTPTHPEAWSLRGEVYEEKGDLDRAAHDFHQAFLLHPGTSRYAGALARLREKQGRPCDAWLCLIHHHLQSPPALREPNLQDEIKRLAADRRCDHLEGRGYVVVRSSSTRRSFRVNGTINGKRGVFEIDRLAPVVVLQPAFAAAAGINAEGAAGGELTLRVSGDHQRTRLTKLSKIELAGASAADVDAVILPVVPKGVDALIGGSFLSRFHLRESGSVLELGAELPKSPPISKQDNSPVPDLSPPLVLPARDAP